MRKITILAVGICAAVSASGATPEVSLKNEVQAAQGTFNPETSTSATSQWNQTLAVQAVALDPVQFDAALTLKNHDYSSLALRDARQNAATLAPESEWVATLAPTWESGSQRVAATWQGSLGSSAFAQQNFGLEIGQSFFNRSTRLEADARYADQRRPADFYVDDQFRVRERPRKVQTVELGLAAEQNWTDSLKSRLRLSTREKRWERPRSVGLELSQGFALGDHWFSQLHLGRYQELRGQALLNDRGYFDAWTAKAELSFEPAFDWLITAAYALGVEYEVDSRIGRDVRVGSDQYALAVAYQARRLRVGVNTAFLKTNTDARIASGLVELGWAL